MKSPRLLSEWVFMALIFVVQRLHGAQTAKNIGLFLPLHGVSVAIDIVLWNWDNNGRVKTTQNMFTVYHFPPSLSSLCPIGWIWQGSIQGLVCGGTTGRQCEEWRRAHLYRSGGGGAHGTTQPATGGEWWVWVWVCACSSEHMLTLLPISLQALKILNNTVHDSPFTN